MLHLTERLLGILTSLQRPAHHARNEKGQTLAEYGFIVTVIGVALVAPALIVFREHVASAYASVSSCLDGMC